jgi:hypothetical protein
VSSRISEYIRNNILGVIAIYLALGGIGVASHGAPNSIDSADIINGEVKTADIAPQQVRTGDVARDTGPNALTGTNIAADTITDADIAAAAQFNGAAAGGDLQDSYPAPTLAPGAVSGGAGGEIADDTVTGADVDESTLSGVPLTGAAGGDLTGNYPDPTIAGGAVGSAAVGDGSLTAADLGTGSVASDEVALNSLTGADVADTSTLSGAEILESGLTVGGDLTGTVANAQIAADAVGTAEVGANALGGADIFETSLGKVPSATSADFAGDAGDASTLDGIDSAMLVIARSDVADTGECTGSLPEVFETCADVTLTFPHPGRALVIVTAGVESAKADGPGTHVECQLQVDESTTVGVPRHFGDWGDDDHPAEAFETSIATHALTDVLPAGSHPFEFNCKDFDIGDPPANEADIDNAYISALVVGSG